MDSLEDLELAAAISHASKNDGELEHPWYGVWALVLRKLCRIQKGKEDGWFIVPVIYPQDPVAHVHVDLQRIALQRQSVALSPPSPTTRRTGAQQQRREFNIGPSTPPSSNLSTTNVLGSPFDLTVKQKKRKLAAAHSDSEGAEANHPEDFSRQNYESKAAATKKFIPPPGANRNLDSKRYPDFSRIISFYAPHLPSPCEIRDLIVENKLRILVGNHNKVYRWMHGSTRQQTTDQAWHAFQSDKNLKIIGCIMAYGEFWTYEEYRREDIPDPITTPGDEDEYVPSDDEEIVSSSHSSTEHPTDIPTSTLSNEIDQLFDKNMWLEVGTKESDHMLSLIEKRLREIHWGFWGQVTP